MSEPTRKQVSWMVLVQAGEAVGLDLSKEDVPTAVVMFAEKVEDFANNFVPPPDKPEQKVEDALGKLVVDAYNDVVINKVPVFDHPSLKPEDKPRVAEAAVPADGDVVKEPIPEPGKKRQKIKEKVDKEAVKAAKAVEREAAKAAKAAERLANKVPGVPGAREKTEGFAFVLRSGILNNDPEGVVIQRAYEEYKKKGIPEGKDEAWALARAKRTYHHIYAELVKQGRMEAKPKPTPAPKKEKEAMAPKDDPTQTPEAEQKVTPEIAEPAAE